ncbi:MAG: hypothetical protein JWN44_923 [Myxococcales bacterium]|nr:hypothetical protein [Myxococcales bacterium]
MRTRAPHLFVLLVVAFASVAARVASAQQPPAQQPPAPPPSEAPAASAAPSPLASTVAPPSAAAPAPKVSFTVKPYGLITLTASYLIGNSSNNPDVPEWATAGPSAFYFTVRQTRLGVRGSWDAPPSRLHVQKVAGLIEADFYGGFLGQGVAYFFPVPRLRLATATVEWHTVRFSFGQDWSVLAPLNPDTALHVAVPGFTSSGNLWARVPQLRVDGVVRFGRHGAEHKWRLLWTAALVAEVQADAIATAQNAFTGVRIPEGGENALAPAGEARVAIGHDLYDKSLEIGVSGHLGNRNIAFTGGRTARLNGAVAVDVTLPLPLRLSLKGEAYWGSGLDAFFGGIVQGIAFTTDPATGAIATVGNGIADAGGWAQLSWAALKWLTLYAGGGADKPKTVDLIVANAATNRTLNAAFYGELSVEFARGFALWLEYDFMHTEFQAAPTQRTHVLALAGQLTF